MRAELSGIVLDCADAQRLAEFYGALLGWPREEAAPGWAALSAPGGWTLAFQQVPGYTPPVWPWREGAQGQMMHLDFHVKDLKGAARWRAVPEWCRRSIIRPPVPCWIRQATPSAWITASRNRLPMAECSEDGGCAPAQSGPASPAGQNGWKRLKSPARGQGFLFCTFLEEGGHIFYGHHGKADHSCRQRQI